METAVDERSDIRVRQIARFLHRRLPGLLDVFLPWHSYPNHADWRSVAEKTFAYSGSNPRDRPLAPAISGLTPLAVLDLEREIIPERRDGHDG